MTLNESVAAALNEHVGKIARKITPSMVRMLEDVHDHGDPNFSVNNRSQAGGASMTFFSLRRRNLITVTDDLEFVLTLLGKLVLARVTAKERTI